MIRFIKNSFRTAAALAIGSFVLLACEPETDGLGSQFFGDGAEGIIKTFGLTAYNVSNGQKIRSDDDRLQSATLGAFNEPQFGMQKSSYVTQLRLSSYSPDFGTNPVLDSAVLVIKPYYAADSVTTTTNEDYIWPQDSVAAKKVVNTYPIAKYGKAKLNGKTIFNIKVQEVTDFLYSPDEEFNSDKTVNTGAELGTKVFDGNVSSIKITKKTDDTNLLFERAAGIRIPLDSAFFQNKIITKGNAPQLTDAASFIRYFKGIRVSVQENDGYIFSFDPNSVELKLYYKNDKTEGTTTTRVNKVFDLNAGAANTHFSQIQFSAGSNAQTAAGSANSETGDARLYAQGMGGPGFALKIPAQTIADIKEMYKNQQIGIISAKMRLYVAEDVWNNTYRKPQEFTVQQEGDGLDTFLEDLKTLYGTGLYQLVRGVDLEKSNAYYDISITQTIKNIIEKEATAAPFIVNVGAYLQDGNGSLLGMQYPTKAQQYNTRSFTPNRVVLVGTDPGNAKSASLILTYGKK